MPSSSVNITSDGTPRIVDVMGATRARVLAKRRKARLGDALIAQSCIDQDIPLLTGDRDFRTFSEAAGLHLLHAAGG